MTEVNKSVPWDILSYQLTLTAQSLYHQDREKTCLTKTGNVQLILQFV